MENTTNITNGETLSLEKLFSAMLLDCRNEIKKENFVSTILEANQELEMPFLANAEALQIEMEEMIKTGILQDGHYYYRISRNKINQSTAFANMTEEERHAYFKLEEAYITKNMEANQKKKA